MTVPGKGDHICKSGPSSPHHQPLLPPIPQSFRPNIKICCHQATSTSTIPSSMILKTLLKTLIQIILKLWRWASSFLVLIFLAAWFYGGLLPYGLLVIAFMSKIIFCYY